MLVATRLFSLLGKCYFPLDQESAKFSPHIVEEITVLKICTARIHTDSIHAVKYLFLQQLDSKKALFSQRQLQECWSPILLHRATETTIFFIFLKEYLTFFNFILLLFFFTYGYNSCGKEEWGISLNLCYLNAVSSLPVHTDRHPIPTEQNLTQGWNNTLQDKGKKTHQTTLKCTGILFFTLPGLTDYSQDENTSDESSQLENVPAVLPGKLKAGRTRSNTKKPFCLSICVLAGSPGYREQKLLAAAVE